MSSLSSIGSISGGQLILAMILLIVLVKIIK